VKISSYNITDVGYHYIGLRVLAGLPSTSKRDEQTSAISRSVLKYVTDRSLRFMLPEPKGTFETVGEKVCQELVHFQFARSVQKSYELTNAGKEALALLDGRKHRELRRVMVAVHLNTYENLRAIVQRHIEIGYIWRPIVEAAKLATPDYLYRLLKPSYENDARDVADEVWEGAKGKSPKKVEDLLHEQILQRVLPRISLNVPLFRSLCDRLVSLRILNIMRTSSGGCEFDKSYSPCAITSPSDDWYIPIKVHGLSGEFFTLFYCEPSMGEKTAQQRLLAAVDEAFHIISPQAGYYDLPNVRDYVCDYLRIPEASFDEGINELLDWNPAPLTVGLKYEGISARRKPLMRNLGSIQIYNLIRRT